MCAFYAYLKTGEVLALWTSQCYLDAFQKLVFVLGQSKSGKRRGESEYGSRLPQYSACFCVVSQAT